MESVVTMNLEETLARAYAGKKVVLTGHTGFKGAWLAHWLAELGAHVWGYALDPPTEPNLYEASGTAARLEEDVRADLADADALTDLFRRVRPDFAFHLAAQPLVRLSYETPVATFETNVMGTVRVMEALRTLGNPCRAVMITTDKCYENREWLHAYREEDAMGGYDPYSASKGCAELAIAAYRSSFFERGPVRLASARAGNVIGGGDWAADRIVPDCIRAVREGAPVPVRNKTATRPWQHVLEPLSGYLLLGAALDHPEWWGRKDASAFCSGFNFGPSLASNRTVAELVDELLRCLGRGTWVDRSEANAPHEASKLNLATDKAFHLLGWSPAWDFGDALRHTADWYASDATGADMRALTLEQIRRFQQNHPFTLPTA